jgi:uncharacterized membrane protein SirB2
MKLLLLIIGAFLIFMGVVVWIFKILEITPGFNDEAVVDRKSYATFIGINYILMGITIVINSYICSTYHMSDYLTVIFFTLILYVFITIIFLGSKKYKR